MGLGIIILFMIWPVILNTINYIPKNSKDNSEIDKDIDSFRENFDNYYDSISTENVTYDFHYSGLITVTYSKNSNGTYLCKFRFASYTDEIQTYSDVSYRTVQLNNVFMIEVQQIYIITYEIYRKNGSIFLSFD